MTLYECLRRCTGICNESWVTCMKELWTVALLQIRCQLHDHAKQYDNDGVCQNRWNGGKFYGNISQNGYGNAMIGRYIWWMFWGRYMVGVWYQRKVHGIREASNGGRKKSAYKELIYLLQKSTSYQSKVLRACSQGDRLVGKDHRSSPTATI